MIRFLTWLLLSSTIVPGALAQGGPPPEVARAQAQMAAKDFRGAIATLDSFFTRNPTAVQGRLILGNAHRQLGELDQALAAYQSITQPPPIRLQGMLASAGIHAVKGDTARAFQTLAALKATGAFDMDLARSAPDLAGLQSDPRFEALMFRAEDFTRPFVENVRIIREWVGETKGDQYSWIARSIPDVDGDKVRDVVTSAPTFGAGAGPSGPGKVYLYSGKSGALLWSKVGDSAAMLGMGLEGAGDVDGDGRADVIAGAPGVGRALVLSGRDGRVVLTLSGTAAEGFGGSASGAGDQNGDGRPDLLVGAPSASVTGSGAGRVYLFSGKDGSVLRTWDGEAANAAFGSIVAGARERNGGLILIGAPGAGAKNRGRVYAYQGAAPTPHFVIEADETGAALGAMFTSVVGDVDGDKVGDVFASDFANTALGAPTGRAYVHSGKDGRRLLTFTGEGNGGGFGIGSAELGDIDKDGYDDLVMGAWQFAGAAASGGKIYVFSGKDGRLLRSFTGRIPGETLGFDATGAGDVDGDGTVDLLVTSSWSNIRGFHTGRMYLISGR